MGIAIVSDTENGIRVLKVFDGAEHEIVPLARSFLERYLKEHDVPEKDRGELIALAMRGYMQRKGGEFADEPIEVNGAYIRVLPTDVQITETSWQAMTQRVWANIRKLAKELSKVTLNDEQREALDGELRELEFWGASESDYVTGCGQWWQVAVSYDGKIVFDPTCSGKPMTVDELMDSISKETIFVDALTFWRALAIAKWVLKEKGVL